jgi:hypothetical protein
MVAFSMPSGSMASPICESRVARGPTARLQTREIPQQGLLGRVHQAAVEGVFQVELAPAPALARQRLHGRVDVLDGPRHRDGLGAVVGGDVEAGVILQEDRDLVGRRQQHRHGAEAARRLLVLAAVEDDLHGLFEAEDAGGLGRRDLADAVAQHVARLQAVRPQGGGRGAGDREDQRLRDPGQREARLEVFGEQGLLQRPVGELQEQRVDPVEGRAERGVLLVGLAAHAGPLAAVARIHEGDLGRAVDGGAEKGGRGVLRLAHGAQHPGQVGIEGDGEARGQALAAMGGGPRDAGDFARVGTLEALGIVEGEFVQRRAALGGEQQHLGRAARPGGGRLHGGGRAVGEDDVRVGAAEAEGVHAGESRLAGARQRQGLVRDGEIELAERDVRVQFGRVQRGREQVVFEGQARLEQAREARDRLGVTDVALDGADGQRRLAGPSELAANGAGLDRVADRGAGAVGLNEDHGIEVDLGFAVDLLQQGALRVAGGQRDAGGAPVRVDAARRDHAAHGAAVAQCRTRRFQHQDDAALGAHVAVGARREGLTQARAGEHLRVGEADEVEGARQQVDAGHDRRVDPAA